MNTLAVTGASGYLGRALLHAVAGNPDWRVRALSRNPPSGAALASGQVEWVRGDLFDPNSLRSFVVPGATIVHLAYSWRAGAEANLAATATLLDEARCAGVARLVHCSTAAVVGRVSCDPIDEETPCRPVTEYGRTKLEIERLVRAASGGQMDVVILRPTSVFGPGGAPLQKLADDLLARRATNYVKSLLFGERQMNLVQVSHVIDAILFLSLRKGRFDGEIFIVSDDDQPGNTFQAVERMLIDALGISGYRPPARAFPPWILALVLRVLRRNNVNPRSRYSSRKLHSLGVFRTNALCDAVVDYGRWYLTQRGV